MNIEHLKRLLAAGLTLGLLTGCTLTERLDADSDPAVSTPAVSDHEAGYFGLAYYTGEQVNPVLSTSRINRVLVEALYEGMVYLDNTFQPQPILCESWAGDGVTFTFRLKQDVRFWSGAALTAEDVVYSLHAAMANEQSPYHSRMADVESVYAEDDDTVGIVLRSANMDFPRLMDIPVFRAGTEEETFADGTGAYQPRHEEGNWQLTPYADWHGGASGVFTRIDLVSTARSDAAVSSFDTGDVSLMRAERISAAPITLSGAVDLHQTPTTNLHYLGFGTQEGPFSLPAVRRAVAALIARQSICDNQLQTFADPAVLPVNPQPSSAGDMPDMDREAAAALLAEADIADTDGDGILDYDAGGAMREPFAPSILVNGENAFKVAAAQHIADSLLVIGIKASVEAVPFEEYLARLSGGDVALYYGETRMTPDFDLRQLISANGALNFGRYVNPYTDSLVQLVREQGTDEARENLYHQFLQDMPIAPIAFIRDQVAVRANLIAGFSPTPNWLFHGVAGWRRS